jgi:hypothetical protein
MAYEELFADLLKAEREEDVTDALTVFGLEKFSDSNWLPYGGIENNYGIIGAQQADAIGALVGTGLIPGAHPGENRGLSPISSVPGFVQSFSPQL